MGFVTWWTPSPEVVAACNLRAFADANALGDFADIHRWSVEDRPRFWAAVVERLGIVFADGPGRVIDGNGRWFPDARLNIVDSCFNAPGDAVAVVHRSAGATHRVTYGELSELVGRAAAGLSAMGLAPGDPVAIAMPMTIEAVVAYLGVAAVGGTVVSIADSFAASEIATRLHITGTEVVVTSDAVRRANKVLPMYDKVVEAGGRRVVVVGDAELRSGDLSWDELCEAAAPLRPITVHSDSHLNILFSSGTTGDPKAIPWTHLTPIKSAMDGHFHQDIRPGDVVAWPTNLGWMMGPWLIFASLINGASMALYDDAPTTTGFVEFVEEAGVTMLGVVPSLVAAWRSTAATDGADWSSIRVLSSTGEASSEDDMAWLMAQAGGKPMIEYCGGTEIGGGYITGSVMQRAVPGLFSTPALGLDVAIFDDDGAPADSGELFIVGPSVGLSTELLNNDHHEVYHANVPRPGLRRHGDHMERTPDGYFRALGRIDDTMNLGGIKVSSAEIERVAAKADGVVEVAAIAESPAAGGPSRLVIFAVVAPGVTVDPDGLRADIQLLINRHLNPLFKIAEVVPIEALPRTASAKVMRRELRAWRSQ
jgi:acetyl-CoA synthetase